ncbi:phage tail tape measure protein [Microvirga soli]|uniref:phage tail tape measure protein n=1 Tax=Microvirga soli TaxID=1854496 RepID=UPI001FE3DE4E|nr:phage tail tape measure protein [Microvirga soli]
MSDKPAKSPVSPTNSLEEDRKRQLNTLIGLSERFGESLSTAFAKNISEVKKFDNVLKDVRKSFTEFALRSAMAPLQMALSRGLQTLMVGLFGNALPIGPDLSGAGQSLGGGLSSLLGSLVGAGGSYARGGVFSRGMVMPFAKGGVVGAPTYFPLGRGLGLMGEQGAEAVMPLARGPDGRLGVRGGGGGRPVSVTVNVTTPDADSFRRSEAQVSAALARAVARGQRGM